MQKPLVIVTVFAVMLLGQVGVSYATVDIFLYIPGIKGESRVQGRTDWSQVLSIAWGHAQAAPGTTGAKVAFESVAFTKIVDSTSPALALAAASGQPFPQTVVLEFVKAGEQPIVFARLELTGVRVAQYKAGGSGSGSQSLTESVALNFAAIRWIMERIGPTGQPIPPRGVAGWDVVNNKAY